MQHSQTLYHITCDIARPMFIQKVWHILFYSSISYSSFIRTLLACERKSLLTLDTWEKQCRMCACMCALELATAPCLLSAPKKSN